MRAIEKSGSNYDKPDGQLGYGTPDFYKAYRILSGETVTEDKVQRPGIVKRTFIDAFHSATSGEVIKP